MKILVDGDSCPGKNIIEKAGKSYEIKVIIYCDLSHNINSQYSEVKYIDVGFQSVDIALINDIKSEDIVVTQDYGVAAIALSKNSYVINPKGYIYGNDNIDKLLFERHLSSKIRRSGGKTSNPKKRIKEDDERLYKNLIKLIKAHHYK